MRVPPWMVGAAVATALVVSVVVGWRSFQRSHDLRDTRIALANERAAHDQTVRRLVAVADSQVMVATRLATQRTTVAVREAFRDSLAGLVTAVADLTVERDSLRLSVDRPVTVQPDGAVVVRDSLDALDSLGVAAAATVTIDTTARWDWRLYRAALPLSLQLSCRGDLAVAQVAGPPWALLAIDSVVQSADLCIPPPPPMRWNPFTLRLPSLPWVIGLVAVGFVLGAR